MNPMARALVKWHDIFLYLTILISFLAVITAYAAPIWLTLGFPAGMVGAHLFYRSGRADPSHNKLWNALILAIAAISLTQYLLNPLLDVIAIGVRFVLALILIKLFSRQGARDEFQLYALSFLVLAGASALSEQVYFGIFFALYVLTGTFALALLHLKTEAQKTVSVTALRQSPFDRLYITILAGISLVIFAASLAVFFAFPRIGLGFFADASRSTVPISGFSDSIEFGSHGAMRDNPTVVMRVEFDDQRPPTYSQLRWRVMSFDTFDGMGWSRSRTDTDHSLPRDNQRRYNLESLYTAAMNDHLDDKESLAMEVYLEPLGRDVVPSVWPTTQLRLGAENTPQVLNFGAAALKTDDYGDLHHNMGSDIGLAYELRVPNPPPQQELIREGGRPLPPSERARYLQLPDVDSRVQDLAIDLTEGAPTNFEKAQAVGDYLIENHDYTVDLPELRGDDPVSEFLFDHREGHCEYFATTAAVLLRSADVPTRVVNGFLGGDWNDVGEYLTVRHGDAHAWVEIYVPDLGWVPYDPTPPIESTFLERSGLGRMLTDSADALRHTWTLWFLEYDLRRQFDLFRDIAHTLSPSANSADDSQRRETSAEEEEEEREPLMPLRLIVFWGGWLLLVGRTYLQGRGQPLRRHWRTVLSVLFALAAGAFWVGWFHEFSPLSMVTGASSVLAAALIPRWRTRARQPADQRLATTLFESIERQASRQNRGRRPGEGPSDYLTRLGEEIPAARGALKVFSRHYLAVRFGQRHLDDQTRRRLRDSAQAVRSALK